MSHMPGMHSAAHEGGFAFGEPGTADKANREVRITMKDIAFEPQSLTVKVGETIRFVVTNTGAVEHDFTLGDAATQAAHRKEMAEMFEKGGEMHHEADPNAITVKSGQTAELTWRFTKAGKLEFDCNIPGHCEAGMTGVIAVTP
jgi:uncharacterized cupredoxin-like copper-binding protein